MRKRLRKKKYLGEFQVLGFEVAFEYAPGDPLAEERLANAFLDEAVVGNGLLGGGGWGHGEASLFLVADGRYKSATELHRDRVRAWLTTRPDVQAVRVGPLRDANYGWLDALDEC